MPLQASIDEGEGLNMTPMIDVVFNLLIFFLLSSTYMQEESQMELQLPTVAQASPLTQAPDEITVNVLADGRIRIQDREYTVESLREFLIQARTNYPDQGVAVRGDSNVRYENVARVISTCKEAGIARLDIMVLEE